MTPELAVIVADALRAEAERLEPYTVIDQRNRRMQRFRNVHRRETREALYARAAQILEENGAD